LQFVGLVNLTESGLDLRIEIWHEQIEHSREIQSKITDTNPIPNSPGIATQETAQPGVPSPAKGGHPPQSCYSNASGL
jgi:hypothetical protein